MQINKKNVIFNVDKSTGDNDGWGFWNHVINGVWEPNTWEVLYRFLSKEYEYIDIGAWIGPTVLFGSQLSKRCVAFEPDPNAYSALNLNLSLNSHILNVECYNIAISDNDGIIKIGTNSKQGDSMSSLLFSRNNSWEVSALTLESVYNNYNINNCNFIKMDIEGGESIVLPSIKNVLEKYKPTLYLALHTAWINDKNTFLNNVKSIMGIYNYTYTADGNLLDLNNLHSLPGFTEILGTDQKW
jgi:FkbM family methyltransferase